jgi:hypothetical protein
MGLQHNGTQHVGGRFFKEDARIGGVELWIAFPFPSPALRYFQPILSRFVAQNFRLFAPDSPASLLDLARRRHQISNEALSIHLLVRTARGKKTHNIPAILEHAL